MYFKRKNIGYIDSKLFAQKNRKAFLVIGDAASGSGAIGDEAGPRQYLVDRRKARVPESVGLEFALETCRR